MTERGELALEQFKATSRRRLGDKGQSPLGSITWNLPFPSDWDREMGRAKQLLLIFPSKRTNGEDDDLGRQIEIHTLRLCQKIIR